MDFSAQTETPDNQKKGIYDYYVTDPEEAKKNRNITRTLLVEA
jgi:hypothetical protein